MIEAHERGLDTGDTLEVDPELHKANRIAHACAKAAIEVEKAYEQIHRVGYGSRDSEKARKRYLDAQSNLQHLLGKYKGLDW